MSTTTNVFQVTYRLRTATVYNHRPTMGQCKTWTVTLYAADFKDACSQVQAARGIDGKRYRAVNARLVSGDTAAWNAQIIRDYAVNRFVPWAPGAYAVTSAA